MVGRDGEPVEIISVKGRGKYPVVGYAGSNKTPQSWQDNGRSGILAESPPDRWDLFFAPKVEVVHVYRDVAENKIVCVMHGCENDRFDNGHYHIHLGTITGPIVPPEKSEASK